MDSYLEHAIQIVREAGQIAKHGFGHSSVLHRKPLGDVVTDIDLQIESHILTSLAKLYPDHDFNSEEQGCKTSGSAFTWILDPIDGSKYYAKGLPLYSISLALEQSGKMILGVVYSPQTDQLFAATSGRGATLNRVPIRCSGETHLAAATLFVELPNIDSSPDERNAATQRLKLLIDHVYRVRVLGTGALGLCYCGMGGVDAYLNLASPWKTVDLAAGQVIVEEAGGVFLSYGRNILAGSDRLCQRITTLIDLK
jgi:myo-inositol-1(or 4)-monophosphatase